MSNKSTGPRLCAFYLAAAYAGQCMYSRSPDLLCNRLKPAHYAMPRVLRPIVPQAYGQGREVKKGRRS